MATGSDDGTAGIWDMRSYRQARVLSWSRGGISAVSFSRDGKFLLAAGQSGEAVVWDVDSGRINSIYKADGGGINAAAFSGRDYIFATGAADNEIKLWGLDGAGANAEVKAGGAPVIPGEAAPQKGTVVQAAAAHDQPANPVSNFFRDGLIRTLAAALLAFLAGLLISALTRPGKTGRIPNIIYPRLSLFERERHIKTRYVALDIRGFTKADNNMQKLWIKHFNDMLDSILKHYNNYLLILMGDGAMVCFIGEKQDPYCHIKFAVDCVNECSGYKFTLKTAISEGDDWLKEVNIDGHKSANIYGNGIIRASRLLSGVKSEKNQVIVDEISYKVNIGNSKEFKDNFVRDGMGKVEIMEAQKKHEEEIEIRYVLYTVGSREAKTAARK